MTDGSGSTAYTYRTTGLLGSQTQVIGGTKYVTQWSYDALDRLTNLSYPGGVQAIYGYGSRPDGRVSSVQVKLSSDASPINVATSISYLPFGPMTKFTHSNGLARTKAYDTDFWLSSIVTGSFQDITYDYNDRGEVTSIVFPSGSYNQAIQYDNIGRMKAVAATDPNAGAESITFTASGNRDLYTWEGQTDDYLNAADSNRLKSITGARPRTFTYDAVGNLVKKTGWNGDISFGYDAFKRMNLVTRGSSVTAYHYNGLDQRVRRTGAAGNLGFIHAPSGELLATTMQNGDADIGSRFIYVDGEVAGLIRSGKLYAVHNNHLGRAQYITDPAKTVVWRATLYSHQRKVSLDNIDGHALDNLGG